eukprot:CAMPEP_0197535238 /NCGR_PEP_ID=MMETSP1318-20131121/49848_1 /TAXON_ID=552666 /ORGANISM="Partenskyella glossopodia, Strain RCC365" /LENGTH=128 /DNA_ID=CAMNT_0043092757 /DNA_START=198 /DNA_END=584 /DNA_ORIENTATION=+
MPEREYGGGQTYGSSHTERHLLDRDFMLENVLRRNQNKFIDVTSQFTPLDEKEAVDRVKKYAKIKMDLVECSTPKLPTPFKGTFQDITNVLQKSHPTSRKIIDDFESTIKLLKEVEIGEEKETIVVSW